jgi:hypothetical protein
MVIVSWDLMGRGNNRTKHRFEQIYSTAALGACGAIGETVGTTGFGAAVLTDVGVDAGAGATPGAVVVDDIEPAASLKRAKAL